ncbi:MAG: FISUMP domain-containing protein [Bacteroidales bacterium]|nr:FISUMP domain-containing protein [Bacteroidales bacterium]
MRKILCFIAIALMGIAAFAQTVTLTFTGRDAADHYVQLNRVSITNLTKGWQETIYWPDTTLTMQNGTGIDESVANGGFALSQNNPNPFSGTTDVNLTVADAGAVTLKIVDGNGKIVETRHGTSLQPGTHQFRVSLSAAGTYVMTARQNGKTSSVKMVCNGGGSTNAIEYLGMVQTITFVLKSTTTNPFNFGDMMEYVGYATINGTEVESQRITQAQGTSQTFVLQFDATQLYAPSIMTASVSDITAVSATCGGNVTNDGGATVTAYGVCWSTTHNPTVSSSHTTDGSGTGSFTSSLTSLTPNTTYYVRAYATNSAGTAYGNEVSFATECDSVSVNISGNTEINYGESATLTATGADTYHWSNNAATEIITVTPIITTTYTVTGTNLYGCYDEDSITVTVNPVVPTVSTGSVVLTPNSATCGGDVNSDGGATVTARGVCWSASPNPTISGSYTTDGTGTGSFTSNLTGLTAGTTYYVRAYATNSIGTAYGNEVSFVAAVLPVVNTATPTNIMATSATCGGNVTNDGSAVVTDRGVCWSTTHNPTTSNSHTTNGSGTGSFTSSLTGLTTGTTYYVRAYATNSLGTAYGEEVCIITLNFPTVTTTTITDITSISATCGGNVTSDGGATVTARGVCWSTSQNPTISGSHTTDGTGTGIFTSSLTGLASNTTYYVRAYATNGTGTAYGTERIFTTTNDDGQPCPGTATVTDIDNNTYSTVKIGNQCWLQQNLRTTHYANGTYIALGNETSTTTAYRYYPNNNSSYVGFGYLYNWKAVMGNSSSSSANPSGVQGICPDGWHVPSDAEWTQLTNYVSSQSQYVCGGDNTYIAKALASTTTQWYSNYDNFPIPSIIAYTVGFAPSANNSTGFSALPAGCYGGSGGSGSYGYFRERAIFWSATECNNDDAYDRSLSWGSPGVSRGHESEQWAHSVRCLRNEGDSFTPQSITVTTTAASLVQGTIAICGGYVSSDGGSAVTSRGVCWSTSPNPTISNSHTTDGIGTGPFISNLTDLTPNTTYYVRAYATNSIDTAYGNEVNFTTNTMQEGQPCPGAVMVTDIDLYTNTYNTVVIGNQCWLKENLKTLNYCHGTYATTIALGSDTSTTTAYRYYPNNNSSNVATYGYLYNWKAVMGDSSSSNANPSGVRGICPPDWHVPSDAEWTQLTNYVSSQSQYVCGDDNTQIAKALASTTEWGSSSNICAVGNTPNNNNATGFSALPANLRVRNSYDGITQCAAFWSSTESSFEEAYTRVLFYDKDDVDNFYYSSHHSYNYSYNGKDIGHSVRCLRNENASSTVSTTAVSSINITETTAICGGNVTSDGGTAVTARGVCWSTSHFPTINDSHTTDGSGTGSFTSSITGLIANTTYYVRAYATNHTGTAYGNEIKFISGTTLDGQPCPEANTVTDIDNNIYNTVKIGNQCWMKENLRTTRYANGTSIPLGSTFSSTAPYRYNPNNNSSNVSTYGYLYNWKSLMGNSSSSNANPSGVQGVCPDGWHVPSVAEWTQLTNYVSSRGQYHYCTFYSNLIAKALASTTGWNSTDDICPCVVGNTPSNNNATGFSALPAGYYDRSSCINFGSHAIFWSSTESDSTHAYYYWLYRDDYNIYRQNSYFSNYGFSVRCLRD